MSEWYRRLTLQALIEQVDMSDATLTLFVESCSLLLQAALRTSSVEAPLSQHALYRPCSSLHRSPCSRNLASLDLACSNIAGNQCPCAIDTYAIATQAGHGLRENFVHLLHVLGEAINYKFECCLSPAELLERHTDAFSLE